MLLGVCWVRVAGWVNFEDKLQNPTRLYCGYGTKYCFAVIIPVLRDRSLSWRGGAGPGHPCKRVHHLVLLFTGSAGCAFLCSALSLCYSSVASVGCWLLFRAAYSVLRQLGGTECIRREGSLGRSLLTAM